MKLSRRTGRASSLTRRDGRQQTMGWTMGLMFNLLLLALPLLAGRVTINAFAEQGFGETPSAEAVSQTRAAIDRAFSELVAVAGDPDQVWAQAVDGRLQANDLAGARGFLLAGPQMMSRERALALSEAAREEPSGSEDERLARAALIFLPDAVRQRYQQAFKPAVPEWVPEVPEAAEGQVPAQETATEAPPATGAEPEPEPELIAAPAETRLMLVGDGEDLANRSARWLRGEATDTMILRLRAVAQLGQELVSAQAGGDAPFTSDNLALGVSVLSAAHRAERLQEGYVRNLTARVEAAVPEARLRAALEAGGDPLQPLAERIAAVKQAYLAVMKPNSVRRLALEVERVARLAQRTDTAAAVELLSVATSDDDLRRLNIVVDAGGERAVALLQQPGVNLPMLATTGVKWTRDLYLQVMGLAALAMAIVWSLLSALNQSIFPSGRSAYLA